VTIVPTPMLCVIAVRNTEYVKGMRIIGDIPISFTNSVYHLLIAQFDQGFAPPENCKSFYFD